jgi:hypothetical protein
MLGRTPARVALVVIAVAAAFAAYQWWTSPERQIRRILDAVAAAFTHDAAGTPIEAVAAVASLQQHLAPDVSVRSREAAVIEGRPEVLSLAARVRAVSPMMRVRFFDPDIVLEGQAAGRLTATAEVITLNEAGREVADAHQIDARVILLDGRWVVSEARLDPEPEP